MSRLPKQVDQLQCRSGFMALQQFRTLWLFGLSAQKSLGSMPDPAVALLVPVPGWSRSSKKATWSIGTLTILVVVLLLSSTGAAQGPEKLWVAEFTCDVPNGFSAEGSHSYWYEVWWTYPEPGGYPMLGPYEFTIDEEAAQYLGHALIRFGFGRVRFPPPAVHCERFEPTELHPDQPTRFHHGWPADWEMTYPEAKAHFNSMTVTVHWDDADSADLLRHEIFPYQPGDAFGEHVWPNQFCNWTVRP